MPGDDEIDSITNQDPADDEYDEFLPSSSSINTVPSGSKFLSKLQDDEEDDDENDEFASSLMAAAQGRVQAYSTIRGTDRTRSVRILF